MANPDFKVIEKTPNDIVWADTLFYEQIKILAALTRKAHENLRGDKTFHRLIVSHSWSLSDIMGLTNEPRL